MFLVLLMLVVFRVPSPRCCTVKHKSIGEGCTGCGSEPSQGGGYQFIGLRKAENDPDTP